MYTSPAALRDPVWVEAQYKKKKLKVILIENVISQKMTQLATPHVGSVIEAADTVLYRFRYWNLKASVQLHSE